MSRVLRLSEAQNHRCAYCGIELLHPKLRISGKKPAREVPPAPALNWSSHSKAKKYRRATIDHVVPKCEGGTDSLANTVAACKLCNEYRGNVPAEDAFSRIQRLVRRGTHPHLIFQKTGRFPIKSFKHLPTVEVRT
ncbi:MAG: HNH endonuclease [Afipia felis]|nr:HNH endonuclease [Afipia felis]